ncbi:MAG: hypothetical protein JHC55_00700, partial [Mycolicibacterium sp.]|nr:hypothetical protein [Mycolicibacterium sp.]
PGALNTLDELAAALGDDANFAASITTLLAGKAPLDSPTFTGVVAGITKAMVGLGNVDNTSDATKNLVVANIRTASYTLVLSDAAKVIEMNVATANTLTVPLNSSVAFPIGTVLEVHQYGAGQTTIAATGGVTIRTDGGLKIAAQYGSAALRKRATDEWVATGNLTT